MYCVQLLEDASKTWKSMQKADKHLKDFITSTQENDDPIEPSELDSIETVATELDGMKKGLAHKLSMMQTLVKKL